MQTSALCRLGYEIFRTKKQRYSENRLSFYPNLLLSILIFWLDIPKFYIIWKALIHLHLQISALKVTKVHNIFSWCHFRAVGRSENPGVPVLFGGHNLSPMVEKELTDLPRGRQACIWSKSVAYVKIVQISLDSRWNVNFVKVQMLVKKRCLLKFSHF